MLLAQAGLVLPPTSDALWNVVAVLVWLGLAALLLVAAVYAGRVRRQRAGRKEQLGSLDK